MYNENGGLSLLKKTTTTAKFYIQTCHQAVWVLPDIPSLVLPVKLCLHRTITSHCYQTLERLSRPFTGELPRQVGSRHCSDDVSTSLSLLASFPIVLSVCDSSIFVFIIGKEPAGVDSRVQVKLQCANTMSYSCAASEMLIYVLYFYWGEQWEPQIEEEKVGTNLDVFIWII